MPLFSSLPYRYSSFYSPFFSEPFDYYDIPFGSNFPTLTYSKPSFIRSSLAPSSDSYQLSSPLSPSLSSLDDSSVFNWKKSETDDKYTITLPEIENPESLKVSIKDGNILCVSAEKSVQENNGWKCETSFMKQQALPANVDPNSVKFNLHQDKKGATIDFTKVPIEASKAKEQLEQGQQQQQQQEGECKKKEIAEKSSDDAAAQEEEEERKKSSIKLFRMSTKCLNLMKNELDKEKLLHEIMVEIPKGFDKESMVVDIDEKSQTLTIATNKSQEKTVEENNVIQTTVLYWQPVQIKLLKTAKLGEIMARVVQQEEKLVLQIIVPFEKPKEHKRTIQIQ